MCIHIERDRTSPHLPSHRILSPSPPLLSHHTNSTSVGLSLRNYIAPGVVHMAEELEMVRVYTHVGR